MRTIQRMARGKLARLYSARLRRTYERAGLIITAGVRGHFARKRARWRRLAQYGATCIQRHARSSFARIAATTIKREKSANEAAVLVGKLFQGMRARRRVKRRRELRIAAADAAEAVSIRGLFPADLYELAEAIRSAQVDHRVAYPPAAVLGLVRMVVLILSNERNEVVGEAESTTDDSGHLKETVTDYSAIGVRHTIAVERIDLSWTGATKVLRRAHRLLRRLRALAAGPASIPPRLLSLPRIVLELFDAYAHDPTMTVEAMQRLPTGSRACVQLLTFIIALLRIYKTQADFFEDLGGDEMTPNWLVRKRVAAKRRRALSTKAIVNQHAAKFAETVCTKMCAQGKQFSVHATCLDHERSQARGTDDALEAHDAAEGAHTACLVVRIEDDLAQRAFNVEVATRRVAASDQEVADTFKLARHEGSSSAMRRLPALRDAAAEARVALREARARLATSKRDIAVAERRQANVLIELPPEVRYRAVCAGEARAAARIALKLCQAWICDHGGEQHVRRLALCKPRQSDGSRGNALARLTKEDYLELCDLDARVGETRERARLANEALRRVLEELESEIAKAEEDERTKYARPTAALEPTDEERAEDAREDEYCAVEEAILLGQFVPKSFLPVLDRELRETARAAANATMQRVLGSFNTKRKFSEELDQDVSATSLDGTEGGDSLQAPPERPRPVIVLISCDVAQVAKERIVAELNTELPGLFVRVTSEDSPCGIDTAAMQAPLGVNKCVIAEVDAGLCGESRQAFIDSLVLAKSSLIPTPHVVLVVGDARNRRGPSPPLPREHYGIAKCDLDKMADSALKRQYEDAAENLATLSQQETLDALTEWSHLEYPPSKGHALVLEAAILMLQRSTRLKGPDSSISAVTWIAARRLLAQPLELVARFRDFDPSSLPPATLSLLQSYCAAPEWPRACLGEWRRACMAAQPEISPNFYLQDSMSSSSRSLSMPRMAETAKDWRDATALTTLVKWITAVIAAGEYLGRHGGPALGVSRREPAGLFSRVVTVSDGNDKFDEESEATPRGWRAAFVQVACAILEDCRGHRCAAKLAETSILAKSGIAPKDTIHNVSVYHDCGRIFFAAHNPSNSTTLFTSIHERQVDSLLAPNSIEHAAHAAKKPPDTLSEMYSRLVALLVVERAASGHAVVARAFKVHGFDTPERNKLIGKPEFAPQGPQTPPRLTCRRHLHRLLRETRRISGYLVTLTVYEEARGELRVHAYIPDHAASLDLGIDVNTLNRVYSNADASLGERDAVESCNAHRMLFFVADRIEIVPGRTQAENMEGLSVMRHCLRLHTCQQTDRRAGFCLRVRKVQGPGRRLYRLLVRVSRKVLVMTVYEATVAFGNGDTAQGDRLLRLLLYDPALAETCELRLPMTHCALLLGAPLSGNWRAWHRKLISRVSLRRRRNCIAPGSTGDAIFETDGVSIDTTLFRGVRMVGGRRRRVSIELTAGKNEGLLIRAFDTNPESIGAVQKTRTQKLLAKSFGLTTEPEQLESPSRSSQATLRDYLVRRRSVENKSMAVQQLLHLNSAQVASIWNLPVETRTPVFDKLRRAGEAARNLAIDSLLGALDRDPDTGALVYKDASSTSQWFTASTSKQGRAKSESGQKGIVGALLSTQLTHDGSASSVVRTRRQAATRLYTYNAAAADDSYRVDWTAKETKPPSSASEGSEAPKVAPAAAPRADAYAIEEASSVGAAEQGNTEPPCESDVRADCRLIYQQGVRTSVKPLDAASHQELYGSSVYEDGFAAEIVFVKVFESYSEGPAVRELRFKIYRATTSATHSILISGQQQLREVLGSGAQHLLDPERNEEMIRYLVSERLMLYEGVWDPDTDQYVREANEFTARFKSHRMYEATSKVTPLGVGGDADARANADLLFIENNGALARGKKVLRQAQEIEGVLMHVTAFEMPLQAENSLNVVTSELMGQSSAWPLCAKLPPLRFVTYNPRAQHTCKFLVPPEAIAEVLVALDDKLQGALNKPSARLRDPANRFDLARAVAAQFRLQCFHRAPPEVYLPWSQAEKQPALPNGADPEPDALVDARQPGAPEGTREQHRQRKILRMDCITRPPEDIVRKRTHRVLRRMTRVSEHEVIISVFAPPEPKHALDINVYLTRLRRAVELRVSADEQRCSLGRAVLEHQQGEPREAAFDFLLRHLRLHGVPTTMEKDDVEKLDDEMVEDAIHLSKKSQSILLTLATSPDKPWLTAYQNLDTSVSVQSKRPEGHPVCFVPADTKGDLVVRKGIRIPHGGEVLVTVSSRAPGEPPSHGLVIEAYDPVTSYTATLHIVAQELLKLVDYDAGQLQPERILTAVDGILRRLYLAPSNDGLLKLALSSVASQTDL